MLSYAYQNLKRENYEKIATETFDNALDLFATILATGITLQLKRGLTREYIENQDYLSTLRGKIDLRESMKLKVYEGRRLACRFDELSENHYMNQILKTTALYLINESDVQRISKNMLKKAILFFSNVSTLEPSAINWRALHFHRNNASYRLLMGICYLVLHELLLTTDDGKRKLATFVDDQQMSRLYEKFILEYYKRHFPQYHPSAREIKWNTTGTMDFLPNMYSDCMLVDVKSGKKLIIDAKYYGQILQTQYENDTIRSNNLYQIFAYVKNEDKGSTGLVDGLLLYAKTDEKRFQNIKYNLSGNHVGIKALDLSKDFSEIKNQLNSFVIEWLKPITHQ